MLDGAFGAGGGVGAEEFFDAVEGLTFCAAADGFHGPPEGQAAFAVAGDKRLPVLFHEIPPDIPAQGVCADAGEDADAVLRPHVFGDGKFAGGREEPLVFKISQGAADAVFFFM